MNRACRVHRQPPKQLIAQFILLIRRYTDHRQRFLLLRQHVQWNFFIHCKLSTPIHNNIVQSNAPSTFQAQCYVQLITPTNGPMTQIYPPNTHNLPVILQDIQTKLQQLDLLDNVCERLSAIERKFDIVGQYIAQLKQTIHNQDKKKKKKVILKMI